MRPRCTVCGSKEIDSKLYNARLGLFFCSKQCRNIKYANRFLLTGIIMLISLGAGIAFLTSKFFRHSIEIITISAVFIITGGLLGGYFLFLGIKGTKAMKTKIIKTETKIFACVFCGNEYRKRIYGAPTHCSGCGKPSPFCDICYQYVFHGEQIVQLEDCGHIFHNSELYDWIEENDICPKCKEKVIKINLKIP